MYGAVENGSLVLFMRIAFLHSLKRGASWYALHSC